MIKYWLFEFWQTMFMCSFCVFLISLLLYWEHILKVPKSCPKYHKFLIFLKSFFVWESKYIEKNANIFFIKRDNLKVKTHFSDIISWIWTGEQVGKEKNHWHLDFCNDTHYYYNLFLKVDKYFIKPTLIHLTRMENLMVKLQDCDGDNLNLNLNLPRNFLENHCHKNNHLVRNLLLNPDYNHLMVSEKKSNKEIKNLKLHN